MFEVQHLQDAHARAMAGLSVESRRSRRRLRREHVRLERRFAQARLIILDEDFVPPPRPPLVRRSLTLLLALALVLL